MARTKGYARSPITRKRTSFDYKSRDGVLVIDTHGAMLFANEQARDWLELSEQDLREKSCFEALQAHNADGDRLCRDNCAVIKLAMQNKLARGFTMQVTTKSGRAPWFDVTTLLETRTADRSGPNIIYIFRPIPRPPEKAKPVVRRRLLDTVSIIESAPALMKRFMLSKRQAEVFALLIQGKAAKEIGPRLTLSTATVRTHIQQILKRLRVHSRLEAVAVVLQQKWR